LVPPKPNALTPAVRSAGGTAQVRLPKANGLVSASQYWLGLVTCSVPGRTPVCTARAALITPARPAAHLVCPICDFTEPTVQPPTGTPASVNSSVSAASSVRSPTTVPVPCASTRPTEATGTPADR
jgi:hypothetical protein